MVTYRPWVYGAGFGVQLGAAAATVVNTALVPLFMLAALLSGHAVSGMVLGAAFGAARGASLAAVPQRPQRPKTCSSSIAASTSTAAAPGASVRVVAAALGASAAAAALVL